MLKETEKIIALVRKELREQLKPLPQQKPHWRWVEGVLIGLVSALIFLGVTYLFL